MKQQERSKSVRRSCAGMLAGCSLIALTGTAAAWNRQVFSGTACSAQTTPGAFYYTTGAIWNRNSQSETVVCPMVRDNTNEAPLNIVVSVQDNSTSASVECQAQSRSANGAVVSWARDETSVSGKGQSNLQVTFASEAWAGPYDLHCTVPPNSGIYSYRLKEPDGT